MAKNSGIDADRDMTLTPLGGSTGLLAAFKQKRIDGFCLSSPTSDTAVQEMDGFTLFDMAKGDYLPLKDFLYITLIAKSSWLEENPETATKVVKAIWKAQDLMVNNPEQARDSVRTFFTKTDPELFNLAWKSSAPAFSKTPFIDRESIDKNFSLTEEMEGKRLDLKPEAVYTNIFVEKAQSSR
jgi:NitT/TauT family transport system substrate-binding protein